MTQQHVPSLYDSFALYGSGVTFVSVHDGARDRFFVAASVLTASVDPFTIALSVGGSRDALPVITGGATWAVSVLGTQHLPMVRVLTARTSHAERLDALAATGAQSSPEGPLWLPDALVTLWARSHTVVPVNDQFLLVGEVIRGSVHQESTPLLRWNRDFRTTAAVPAARASVA
ncbi:flavin reductase family protein [Occultella kanbiaonis]|uniref:flavin reductase family protein n=1 Tax=Occultella kanbiaonis TaxID=2675754 RepID=UPI0012B747D7|nr:flavin reductase family protein [Occultella kanbiaonis]